MQLSATLKMAGTVVALCALAMLAPGAASAKTFSQSVASFEKVSMELEEDFTAIRGQARIEVENCYVARDDAAAGNQYAWDVPDHNGPILRAAVQAIATYRLQAVIQGANAFQDLRRKFKKGHPRARYGGRLITFEDAVDGYYAAITRLAGTGTLIAIHACDGAAGAEQGAGADFTNVVYRVNSALRRLRGWANQNGVK